MPLWDGRFQEGPDALVLKLSESISYDRRLYPFDIQGSQAHAKMLVRQGIIPAEDGEKIQTGLLLVLKELDEGIFPFRTELEDIHMNIESRLTELIGPAGARLHTGRSRNDQIATDERLYLRHATDQILAELRHFQKALWTLASQNRDAIMPGFTHLQHAQPILFAHHLLAYLEMTRRDCQRLADTRHRINRLPLGAGALAGSTLPLDRNFVAKELGFEEVLQNSMDAVADRDTSLEFLADLSIIAMHLSRLAEDIILWFSQEFAFIEIGDAFTTGSSLMPQKKNPDMAELTRGKTGRVYGALMGLLTTMKGLPLTYNRDLQEDKEGLFDAIDTVELVLKTLTAMMATVKIRPARMLQAASDPALMATDLAEALVRQGIPFREAHHQVGRFVGACQAKGVALDKAGLEMMRESIPTATEQFLKLFDPAHSTAARNLVGGTAPQQVREQLQRWQTLLEEALQP